MILFDIDFLRAAELPELNVIYEYRTGLLRWAVLQRVRCLVEGRGHILSHAAPAELKERLIEQSLWDESVMVFCDIGARVPERSGIEDALSLIAGGAAHPVCLTVPFGSGLRSTPSWKAATARALVIHEPIVSSRNLSGLAEFLAKWRGFEDISPERFAEAVELLTRAIGREQWDLLRTAHALDSALLTPWVIEDALKSRRSPRGDLLNERLKDFLDWRDPPSMRRLLAVLANANGGNQFVSSGQLLSDLYRKSEKIIARRDKRYGERRAGGPHNIAWALHLMRNERALLSAPFVPAIERICRQFMNVADHGVWLSDPLLFRRSFGLFCSTDKESPLHKDRESLVRALRSALWGFAGQFQWARLLLSEVWPAFEEYCPS